MKVKIQLVFMIANQLGYTNLTRGRATEIAFRYTEEKLNLILRRVYEKNKTA